MKSQKTVPVWILQMSICLLLLTLITGCMGNYGRIKRDSEIFQEFENNNVPSDYTYYYYGFDTRPYVVIGVEPKYNAGSTMWREVEPNSDKFKKMTVWLWEDYGYSRYGARILDPEGNQAGILFSSIREIAVKFSGDNKMTVMPNTPFLWGPSADEGSSNRYYGSVDSSASFSIPHRASYP